MLNTRTEEELFSLLERGGVIAGSSAGAAIQGSFLIRGNSNSDDNNIIIGDHKNGFGFIRHSVIDIHISQNRQFDILEVLEQYPSLLGIGIDQDTAILVKKDILEVIGGNYVTIFDHTSQPNEDNTGSTLPTGSYKFFMLTKGMQFNLNYRTLI